MGISERLTSVKLICKADLYKKLFSYALVVTSKSFGWEITPSDKKIYVDQGRDT